MEIDKKPDLQVVNPANNQPASDPEPMVQKIGKNSPRSLRNTSLARYRPNSAS